MAEIPNLKMALGRMFHSTQLQGEAQGACVPEMAAAPLDPIGAQAHDAPLPAVDRPMQRRPASGFGVNVLEAQA